MKKIIVAIAALLVAFSAHAQFGIVAGLTSSVATVKEGVTNIRNINQYHVGVTYKIGGNFLAVQPSLIYNMKGAKIGQITSWIGKTDINYKTGYLELPVQLQVGIGIGGLARVYGFAEPFIGLAISNEVTAGGQKVKLNDTFENLAKKLEYGVGVGAGVELLQHLQVSVKYYWNVGDVYGDFNVGTAIKTVRYQKCNGVAASVAFLF